MAKTNGEMIGRRLVQEWDFNLGIKRTWHETLDSNGKIRVIRPETNYGIKVHYLFDENGIFKGIR